MSRHYYTLNDKHYYMIDLFENNISDIQYSYEPASSYDIDVYVVNGTTTMFGKEQKIEIRISCKTTAIIRYKLGWSSYSGGADLRNLLETMAENTTPRE